MPTNGDEFGQGYADIPFTFQINLVKIKQKSTMSNEISQT